MQMIGLGRYRQALGLHCWLMINYGFYLYFTPTTISPHKGWHIGWCPCPLSVSISREFLSLYEKGVSDSTQNRINYCPPATAPRTKRRKWYADHNSHVHGFVSFNHLLLPFLSNLRPVHQARSTCRRSNGRIVLFLPAIKDNCSLKPSWTSVQIIRFMGSNSTTSLLLLLLTSPYFSFYYERLHSLISI